MKKANLSVRAEEWENKGERKWNRKREMEEGRGILSEPLCVRRREIKSNSKKYCLKCNFDRIILTQGTISTMLGLPGCWLKQRPQGGAVIERALTTQLLSLAALLVEQCAAPAVFSHRKHSVQYK